MTVPAAAVHETPDDQILITRIANRDEEAFRILADRYTGLLFSVAFRMSLSRSLAEDAVQETLFRIWRGAGSWRTDGGASVRTWICRVAGNVCIDGLRKGGREIGGADISETLDIPSSAPDPHGVLERNETGRIVGAAVRGLPERQRLALVLFHYEGLSLMEIGATLGTSAKAAEGLLLRARKALRRKLKKLEGAL